MINVLNIGIGDVAPRNNEFLEVLYILFKDKSDAKIKMTRLENLGVYLTTKEVKEMESFMGIFDEHSRKEGLAEGEKRLGSLINAMIEHGESNLIQRILKDNNLKETYYKKYHIV